MFRVFRGLGFRISGVSVSDVGGRGLRIGGLGALVLGLSI